MTRIPVEDRRKALIAAAMRVVASRGLHAASTRAIVAEAGMSLASFHYAFESRDELIDRLITETVANEEKAVVPAELDGKTLTELLTEGFMGYVAHLRADPSHEQAMLELTQHALRTRPELARAQYAEYARFALSVAALAAQKSGAEWIVPLPTVAHLVVALTDGLTLNWLVNRDDDAIVEAITAAASAIATLARTPSGESISGREG